VAPGSRLSFGSGEDALTALGRDTSGFVSRTSEPGSPRRVKIRDPAHTIGVSALAGVCENSPNC
jgi:hypothetical protein